ncbi:hypothetical protein [Streptomyces sp. Caat 7-52]|uniref:hypothetical protein n=1 Tax=Streptomyces sp. Caat 7-52 TaxID=2949637 RepID=UPI00203663F4|nr:hypothetical protein [Streptomyces sp. Caat 7-52]
MHLAMYSGLLAAASINSMLVGDVDEEAARAFYQQAYQHAYARLLILVSAFYRIHSGRDSYFRTAAQPPRPNPLTPARKLPQHHHRRRRPPRQPD